jgi:hypothetical protein
MIAPRWVAVTTQPIGIADLLAYLVAALALPVGEHRVYEIGGADRVSFGDLMRGYARQRGLRRLIIPVPVLTPRLSSLWLGLVTPVYARVGRELIAGLKRLSAAHGIPIVGFGHAGNGNIHVNLLYRPEDPGQAAAAPACLAAVFDLVIALDGTLSGEHGIGLAKRDFLPRAIDAHALDLMRAIKAQFDPDGILNPGKLIPPA